MAAHWASATCSWFAPLLHCLTSLIPSLASSCNKQIPNRTSASASPGKSSPTRQPVVVNSNSVLDEVSLPVEEPATRTSNPLETRSTTTAGSTQSRTFNLSRPGSAHPIHVQFQNLQLGKATWGFAVPMITGLLFNQQHGLTHLQTDAIAIAILVGFTMTWNGMLLGAMWPRLASALEYLGVVSILVAFYGMVSSFLPPSLVWACWLCCGLSCLPFLFCLVPPTAVEEE